jgi:hypothetical protein
MNIEQASFKEHYAYYEFTAVIDEMRNFLANKNLWKSTQ